MILISKVLFGSAAVATLAGSMVFTGAVDAARSVGASMGWGTPSEVRPTAPQPQIAEQQADHSDYGSGQLPVMLQQCPGRCDIGLLFSHVR